MPDTTTTTVTAEEYTTLRAAYDAYHAARAVVCAHPCVVTPEEAAKLPPSPTHDDISAIEVYEFVHNPPNDYIVYVYPDRREVGTWSGAKLGRITRLGSKYRSNFGDTRQSIHFRGIDGRLYFGTYYVGTRDTAQVKPVQE